MKVIVVKMVRKKKVSRKTPQKDLIPKEKELTQEQIAQPQGNFLFIWGVGAAILVVILLVVGLLIGHKKFTTSDQAYNPYTELKKYNPDPKILPKSTFEKLLPDGDQVFDWLMKNDYFYEKTGAGAHARFVTPEEKLNIKINFYNEHLMILAILDEANSSRHEYVVKSAEISNDMTQRAIYALQNKNINEAIKDCSIAIDIFPINAKPYMLLTKLYLMTGQEQKLYDILTRAGHSYPNFNNIIKVLDDTDLDNIPMEETSDNVYLANFPENKKAAISFMFDDGEKDVYINALPIFDKYGYKATIPIVVGLVAKNNDDPFWGSWEEWRDAANRGFEIANHSMNHLDSKKLHGTDFDVAFDQAKQMIEAHIGRKITALIFPYDSYDDEAVGRALREHEVVRTEEYLQSYYGRAVAFVYGGPNFSIETANRIVDIGIKRNLWILANCHGVTNKHGILSFKSIKPDFLDKHLLYIHSKADDIWVDTFTKIFEYMFLKAQTKIEIKKFAPDAIDFTVGNNMTSRDLIRPLTVVIKMQVGEKVKSVRSADGQTEKAWVCATDKLCVDVDAFNQNIHVQW